MISKIVFITIITLLGSLPFVSTDDNGEMALINGVSLPEAAYSGINISPINDAGSQMDGFGMEDEGQWD